MILLPRLPGPAAERLIDGFLEDGPDKWAGFDPSELPEAVGYAATGGSRAERNDLLTLRKTVEEAARAHGFGVPGSRTSHARFDAELGASLAEMPLLSSGEALRDDFWAFVGTSLAPDVVYWRFAAARARYLGGVRNTFQRLWLRARALDRGEQHPRRWQLLEALTEDALVQITERPSIGADPVLARGVAEAWLRARRHHGKGAMEPIMRRAALRVRIWNEIRSLADLSADSRRSALNRAFGLPAEDGHDEIPAGGGTPHAGNGPRTSSKSEVREAMPRQPTRVSRPTPRDAIRRRARAARSVLREAKKRHWLSPKSKAALTALQEETCELRRSEGHALAYLLGRMRGVAAMREDVALLTDLVSEEAGTATGVQPDRVRTAASTRDQVGDDSASTAVRAPPPRPPLTENQRLFVDFWQAFQRLAEANSDELPPRLPQPSPYLGYPIGRSGFKLVAVASLWNSKRGAYDSNELRVELAVEGRDGHLHFNALKERREDIERELNFSLVWSKKKPGVKRCRIYVRRTVNLNDRGAWPGYHGWLLAHLLALDRVFRPRIVGL